MDPRIKIIHNDRNYGLAYSLNHCVDVAKGKYIARMDDDDISDTNRLYQEVAFLEQNNKYAFVGCNAYVIDDKDIIIGHKKMIEKPSKNDFLFNSPFIHPTIMIRKSALESIGGYRVATETRRAEDYDLWMRLYEAGMNGYNIQEELFCYREDVLSLKKRKYKYRIDEAVVRYIGFKKLGLFPRGLFYVIKPLFVGLLPSRLVQFIKKVGV